MALTLAKNIDTSAINFSKIRKAKVGNKTIYLNGSENSKLMIQTPFMKAPFGFSSYTDEGSGRVSYSLSVNFDKSNEEHVKLLTKFEDIDKKILGYISSISADESVFGKKRTADSLVESDQYKPLVIHGKKDYADSRPLKMKITNYNDVFQAEAYNMKREKIPLEKITKGCEVACIFEIASIWIIGTNFGVSLRLHQAMVKPIQTLAPCAFVGIEAESDTEDDLEEDEFDEEVTLDEPDF